jgi:hypothetical protein
MTRKFRSRDGGASLGTKDACPLKAVSGIRFEGALKRFDSIVGVNDRVVVVVVRGVYSHVIEPADDGLQVQSRNRLECCCSRWMFGLCSDLGLFACCSIYDTSDSEGVVVR